MKKPTISVEIPEYLQAAVNKLVRYYSEGWRAGYLEGFTKMGAAIIRPIGAIGGTKPQTVNMEQANVQIIAGDTVTGSIAQVTESEYEEVAGPPTKGLRKKKSKRDKTEIIENVAAEIVKRSGDNLVDMMASVTKKTKHGCLLLIEK